MSPLSGLRTIFRQIFTDGRKLPVDPNPTWQGYSIGHWEGDTLVVETTGTNGKAWLDTNGHPVTDKLKVTERFHRTDFGHMDLAITIDDPGAYTKPWTVHENPTFQPDDELSSTSAKRTIATSATSSENNKCPFANPPQEPVRAPVIREIIENWVLYRDAGDWERFRSVWHEDGYMMATWFQGTHEEFAGISKAGMEKGVNILHFLGGCTVDISRNRAIAQTKMSIAQRAPVEGVLCDVTCVGRFYDFLEKRKGKWGIVLRRLFYEKDRIDPVDPSAKLKLEPEILKRYPVGYQHLAVPAGRPRLPGQDQHAGPSRPRRRPSLRAGRAWLEQKPMDKSFRA